MSTIRPQIQIGFRVGKLEVAAPTEERKNGYTVWRRRCDCGNEILLDTRALQRGAIRDCGCLQRTISRDNLRLIDGTSVAVLESGKKGLRSTNKRIHGRVLERQKSEVGSADHIQKNDLLSSLLLWYHRT